MSQPLTWSSKWRWNQKDAQGKPLVWNGMAPEEYNTMDINSAQISDADVQAIKAAFATIEAKMPFMQTLTADDRKGLYKLGVERLSFVQDALQAAKNNPTILPPTYDTAAFGNRLALFQTLTEINTLAAQLASKIDDTHMKVGSILMENGTDTNNYVKAAVKNTPGLKPVADQLGQLYQKAVATRRANEKNKPTPATTK